MTSIDHALLEGYLVRTRWFGGKGRPFRVTGVRELAELPGDGHGPDVGVYLVTVEYQDAEDGTELYQVPLARYEEIEDRHGHAYVGSVQVDGHERHLYDAVHDRDAMALWLRGFIAAEASGRTDVGGLRFRRVSAGPALDPDLRSSPLTGEQSNSSLRFDDTAIMKLFRKVSPGVNPDIEIHDVLTGAGSEHIAELYGWIETDIDGEVMQLAMLQEFLSTAADGFELATGSVRAALVDPELTVIESGGDFGGEAARLGEALAEVHAALRERFPSERRGQEATTRLARAMAERLDRALPVVPEIEPYAARLRALYDAVAQLDGLEVQRVHGDLHLGQTLRTAHGWRIVDFEGEPGRPFAERAMLDSPWRDVAGMLRSFTYAPGLVEMSLVGRPGEDHQQELRGERAKEWSAIAREHFLHAYTAALEPAGAGSRADAGAGADAAQDADPVAGADAPAELSPPLRTLVDAYEADKAVYEAIYEKRNRPSWVAIPLVALERIAAG
ncbi:phosphotransferase [Microbacterium esteraromaticum]|uniref:maltokinase N-terminal cap-like domain-containing protein n=1 Tax=Microbacterium esteraromaticum TaxID=57043 RepID=UPI00309F98F2